jgi:hypothetical protein
MDPNKQSNRPALPGATLPRAAASGTTMKNSWPWSAHPCRGILALALCYFAAGSPHVALAQAVLEPSVGTLPTPSVLAPMLREHGEYGEFDPAHAILPDSRLTPGDTFPGVTTSDVCTPGWASEHRHVTDEMRDLVYEEYRRVEGADCCELDHLIPLELGGSNDIKNLWPQPDKPLPGWADKDELESELHAEVCEGTMTLSDAQRCIASNWVECWQTHVSREHGAASK